MGGWRGGFSFKLYSVWIADCEMSTSTLDFPCKFYWAEGEDLFSFQPMGRPKVPCFYSLTVGGGGKDFIFFIFPCFPMCSHGVSPKFLMGSQYVLHLSTSLLSHMLWQMLFSFHLYRQAQGEELHTSKQNLLFWGASIVSFFGSNGPIKLACRPPKNKRRTWKVLCVFSNTSPSHLAAVNQRPPAHHPLDAHYDSVVDEPQLG